MGTPLGNMVIQLSLDSTKMQSSLTRAQNQLRNFEKQLKTQKGLSQFYKGGTQAAAIYAAQSQTLNKMIATQSQNLQKLKGRYDTVVASKGAMSKEAQRLAGQIETGNAKLVGYVAQLKQAAYNQALFSSKAYQAGTGLQLFSQKLGAVGSAADVVSQKTRFLTLGIAGGMAYGIKAAAEFQNSMEQTKAMLADTVPENKLNSTINQLSKASKDWAIQYGLSTKSVNSGMQELVKAGYDAKQVMAAMPAILNASKASGSDFNNVMEVTSSIISQYNLKAADAGRVTDNLTFVANKTKAGFEDLGLAMSYVGPVAHSVGMSLEETSAAIGILSNQGIKGEKAGTGLRGALTRLLKPSDKNAKAMEKLGFSVEEFRSGALRLPDVIDRIKSSTEGMTDAQKAALIAQAFGTEAQTAMNALVSQGSGELRRLTSETQNATGYTKKLADTMNQSSQAKFLQAKAKLEVLAITIGERLLPAIVPTVEKIGDLAKKFSEFPASTQQSIIKMAILAASISPVSKALSLGANGLSLFTGGLGTLLQKIGGIGAARSASGVISGIGGAATTATAGIEGMAASSGAMAAIFSPQGLLVLGAIAAGGALLYFGSQAIEAQQRARIWGTEVDAVQAGELQTFKNKVDETNRAIAEFGTDGARNVEGVKKAFQGLVDEIDKVVSDKNSKLDKLAEKLGMSDKVLEEVKGKNTKYVQNAQSMSDEVIQIYRNAAEQRRSLTLEERDIVTNAQNELISAQVDLLKIGKDKKLAIVKAMNGEINELNTEQKWRALSTTTKWIEEENKAYNQRKKDLKEAYANAESLEAKREFNDKMEALEAEHTAKMEAYSKKYYEIQAAVTKEALANIDPEYQKVALDSLKKGIEDLGLSYAEFEKVMNRAGSSTGETASILAKNTADMSDNMKAANMSWNAMVFDPKTGEVKTNAQEEVEKALQAENGWETIQFILKQANLETNAKLVIAEALKATGKWDSLNPDEKALVVDGSKGLQAIYDSQEKLAIWNSMPIEVKEMLVKNQDFLNSATSATEALNRWNLLTPTEKALYAKNMTNPEVEEAQKSVNALIGKSVALDAQDNTALGKLHAQETIDSLQGKTAPLDASDNTAEPRTQAQASINSLKGKNAPLDATDNTAGPRSSAQSSVNQLQGKTVGLYAQDNTAGVIGGVLGSIARIPTSHTITIGAVVAGAAAKVLGLERGTNYHRGGLAMVNDQKGPLYKELITLPNGKSFIPEGRNIILPLPRGSKVLRASKTRSLMQSVGIPRYENGVGVPENLPVFQHIEAITPNLSAPQTVVSDSGEVESLLREIIRILLGKKEQDYDGPGNVYLGMEKVGELMTAYQEKVNRAMKRAKGERVT